MGRLTLNWRQRLLWAAYLTKNGSAVNLSPNDKRLSGPGVHEPRCVLRMFRAGWPPAAAAKFLHISEDRLLNQFNAARNEQQFMVNQRIPVYYACLPAGYKEG